MGRSAIEDRPEPLAYGSPYASAVAVSGDGLPDPVHCALELGVRSGVSGGLEPLDAGGFRRGAKVIEERAQGCMGRVGDLVALQVLVCYGRQGEASGDVALCRE